MNVMCRMRPFVFTAALHFSCGIYDRNRGKLPVCQVYYISLLDDCMMLYDIRTSTRIPDHCDKCSLIFENYSNSLVLLSIIFIIQEYPQEPV